MLRYVSKWVGQTLVILGMLLGLSSIAFAQTSLENGTYTLSNNVTHDNPVGQGMARSYTEEQSDLVVSKDGLWLTLGFNNTQYMGEFTIKVNGSQVSYDVVYNSNNIKKLKFKIPSLDATISVGMYVVPMNTEVEYTVTLNQGSLKLVEKEVVEEVKPEEPVTKPESSSGSSSQSRDNTQNNNQPVIKPSTSTQAGSQSSSQSQGNSQTKPDQSTSVEASTVSVENGTQTQIKVEEETNKVDEQVETSENSEQEDVVAETKEFISEEIEAQEPEVKEAVSEIIVNQDAAEETIQEEVVMQEKGSLVGVAVMMIAVIVLVGGVYYWYIKTRK